MSVGPLQIVLILLVVLIVFGAGKLPKVMGDIGKGVKNFKKGLNDNTDSEEGTTPHAEEQKQITHTQNSEQSPSKEREKNKA